MVFFIILSQPIYLYLSFLIIGWAYDLKTVSQDMIKKRVQRTGDGTHIYSKLKNKDDDNNNVNQKYENGKNYWGWGDEDISELEIMATEISNLRKLDD